LLLLFAHDVLPLLLPPAPGGCARPMAGTPTKRRSVGLDGLEPSTSSLSGMRSDRLSYRPESSSASPTPHRTQASILGRGGEGRARVGRSGLRPGAQGGLSGQRRSVRVTSIPPTRSEMRLYMNV